MVEEVLCLSTQRGYMVFYRNHEESNVLIDIVVAHPTSIAMIRTYNMPLLEAVGMTPIGKNFTMATTFIHIDQNMLAKSTEMVKDEEVTQRFVNGLWHKLINEIYEAKYQRKLEVLKTRVWTYQMLHFGVDTTNCAESEHSVLKLWLSMCQGQIAEIKTSLEISKLKEKYAAKRNAILTNISNKISHLALKKIWLEIKKERALVENPENKDENQWPEIRRRMSYDLHQHMNMYVQLFRSLERVYELIKKTNWEEDSAPYEHFMDTPDHLYVIVNTFNFCVVLITRSGSTIVLPLYSNMDCTAGTLFIGFISKQDHFIQLQLRDECSLPQMQVQCQYHRDVSFVTMLY
ncbi:hypothetical protein M9H77_31249 [Catharanthus roseus]|uniref:Uncharacterized protein n=1 Tax=Catharanthus roseus TaxID=4058 RepID=A0ACC0A269_CATRO|nr:hypothetical protein M9H77_31249 [Catharanthus roseus]